MPKEIDPDVAALIKKRDSTTDRYGEDLVFLVVHDLNDPEFIHQFYPGHKAAARKFQALGSDEQYRIVRIVLEEPEPKAAEAADELREALETPAPDPRKNLHDLIAKIETIVPYVTATLGTGNTFAIHTMEGHGDPKDWRGVHAGRAGSSVRQLEHLLETARTMKG